MIHAVHCCHKVVSFLQNPHNRHSIDLWCLLWVQSLFMFCVNFCGAVCNIMVAFYLTEHDPTLLYFLASRHGHTTIHQSQNWEISVWVALSANGPWAIWQGFPLMSAWRCKCADIDNCSDCELLNMLSIVISCAVSCTKEFCCASDLF